MYIFSLYIVIFLTNQGSYFTIKNRLTVRIVAGIEAAILYLCIIKNMLDIMLYKKKGNIMAKEKKLVEAITPMDKRNETGGNRCSNKGRVNFLF